jgi:23S rRNA (cytidine1920-2'-O)/16S rRNA (cytidine1409-2'-O)-methyltransferase
VIALVKPQFELEPKFVKKGVVENAEMQLQAVEKIANFAAKIGLKGVAQTKAKIKGPKGNQEYFLYLQWKK